MSQTRRRLILVLLVVLAAVAVRLGIWQLERLAQRRAANNILLAAQQLPELLIGPATPAESLAHGRRVTAVGQFLPGELLLRSRTHLEAPGVHVVTRFAVDSSPLVLWVLRGFALAADGMRPDSVRVPTPGKVTIRGQLMSLPVTADAGQPVIVDGDTTWRRLDSAMAREREPAAPPEVLYLEGGAAGPGALTAVEPPTLSEGPHLSYAIQWFGIALAILAFSVVVMRRDGRARPQPDAAP